MITHFVKFKFNLLDSPRKSSYSFLLGHEMRVFMDQTYPNFKTSLVSTGCEFDVKKLHHIEGYPSEAKRRRKNSYTGNDDFKVGLCE